MKKITVIKGKQMDVDNFSLDIKFESGGIIIPITGRYNIKTNFVHTFESIEDSTKLEQLGFNLYDVVIDIEDRKIGIN